MKTSFAVTGKEWTVRRMTDNEIIKILTDYGTQCKPEVISAAISLINRQKAEIERLRKEVNLVSIQFQDLQERYEEAHAEIEQWKEEANKYQKLWCIAMDDIEIAQSGAIQEFAERLKEKLGDCYIVSDGEYCGFDCGDIHRTITNLLKEMVGEKE